MRFPVAMANTYNPRTLLNSQPVIVTVIDPDTYRVQFQNTTSVDKLGDLSGRTCYEGIAKCSTPCSFCRMPETVATGEMRANEVSLPDGQHLLVQWAQARTEAGQMHIIETISDITEQKRLERLAQQSHTMEAVSRLANGITHDLSNVITVIRLHTYHLRNELPTADLRGIRAQQIQEAGERAAQLIQRLRGFTDLDPYEPTVVHVNRFLAECMVPIEASLPTGITLALECGGNDPAVLADQAQLHRMVSNLVDNALEAMPHGGRIVIRTERRVLTPDTAATPGVAAGSYVQISITDTGRGMDAATQAHLFEPFFSTKQGLGRGLSLATLYSFARRSGGAVEVVSRLEEGTTVHLLLPEAALTIASTAAPPPRAGALAQLHVLVAEDDDDVRFVVADTLRHAGFLVLEARDGFEAVGLLDENPVDVIVTDLIMPRMTGAQLIEHVRQVRPHAKFILMSAIAGREARHELAGIPRLDKPFSPAELLTAINRL